MNTYQRNLIVSASLIALVNVTPVMGKDKKNPPLNPNSPAYCQLAGLNQMAIKPKTSGLSRLKAYRIGQVVLAGLAVGNSSAANVKKLAGEFSDAGQGQKYCSWYYNDGNSEAERSFNWHNLPRPSGSDYSKMVQIYADELQSEFFTSPNSFTSCLTDHKFLAMGCNGMKHRGPSVFAMLLSFAGCTPDESVAVVNKLWGTNGITPEMRKALAQWAYDFGVAHPEVVVPLKQLLTP